MFADPPPEKINEIVDQDPCANCPPDRVCLWDCDRGQGLLMLIGDALADQARSGFAAKTDEDVVTPPEILELYNSMMSAE